MYGGSLFAVTDGAHPTMLMSALGSDHIVWDKAASIRYRKPPTPPCTWISACLPGKSRKSARSWRASMKPPGRTRWNCRTSDGVVYAVVERTIYIANKKFYKQKTQGGDKCIASPEGEPPP